MVKRFSVGGVIVSHLRRRFTVSMAFPYLQNLRIGQLSASIFTALELFRMLASMVIVAARECFRVQSRAAPISDRQPPLVFSVEDVVSIRSQEQMRRITAWRVVATMASLKSAGVNSVLQEIGNSVSLQGGPLYRKYSVGQEFSSLVAKSSFVRMGSLR